MAIDYREISKDIRVIVAKIVRDGADENGLINNTHTTMGRIRETAEVVKIYRDREKPRLKGRYLSAAE